MIISFINGNREIRISPEQLIYSEDLIKNFDFYFNPVNPLRKDGKEIVDYSEPKEHVLIGINLPFYFTSFAESLESNDIYLDKAKLKEGDLVLDLGAYCGVSSYTFSRAVGSTGKVYAYEPDRDNFLALIKNMKTHDLKNIVPANFAVWSSNGPQFFQGEKNLGSGLMSVLGRGSNSYEVDAVTLDQIAIDNNLDKIDFVKMDIEGSEIEVLRTAENFLNKFKPKLVIEAHYVEGELSVEIVSKVLKSYNYDYEIIPQSTLELPLIFAWPKS